MDPLYRPAAPDDLPACVDIFHESVADLHRRHNLIPPPPRSTWRLEAYQHILATGAIHVVEVDGSVAGFASAFIRSEVWFLAGFWVRVGMQQRHIGAPLLRGLMNAGRESGAKTFFVWASIDLPAMAAYLKNDMLPGTQLLSFEGAPVLPAGPAGYSAVAPDMVFVNRLDPDVLEMNRDVDHAFMQRSGWRLRQVNHGAQPVGYYYARDGGLVGAAAWTDSRHADAVLTLACREVAAKDSVAILAIPGTNHDAVRFALRSGLRLTTFSHLLTSRSFGHLDRYVASGALFF